MPLSLSRQLNKNIWDCVLTSVGIGSYIGNYYLQLKLRAIAFRPVVLRVGCASELPGGLVKTHIGGPTFRVSDSLGLWLAGELVFLMSFHVILMLLVQGPSTE